MCVRVGACVICDCVREVGWCEGMCKSDYMCARVYAFVKVECMCVVVGEFL